MDYLIVAGLIALGVGIGFLVVMLKFIHDFRL